MTSRVATLRLQLLDQVSAPAKGTTSALKGLESSINQLGRKGAPGAKNLVGQLEHLRRKSIEVSRFQGLRQGMAAAFGEFRNARSRVKELEQALSSVAKPTAKMQSELRTAQSALKQTGSAFRAQTAAARAAENALRVYGLNGRSAIVSSQGQIRSQMTQTIRKMREMERVSRRSQAVQNHINNPPRLRTGGANGSPFVDAAQMAGGHGMVRGSVNMVTQGAHQESAANRIRNTSGGEAEVAVAKSIADEVSSMYPSTSKEQSLRDYVEFRSLAGTGDANAPIDFEKMRKDAMTIAKARAALRSSDYDLTDHDIRNLSLALEGSGRAGDPNAIQNIMEAFVRAKQVFGVAVHSDSLRDYVQNAKASNFAMSDPAFYGSTLSRLSQGNASRLGNQASQVMTTLVGGKMTKMGAEWLSNVGLIAPDQIKSGGGGKFYIDGDVKGVEQLSTDPTAWSQQVLMPALQAAGFLAKEKIDARMKVLRDADPKSNAHVIEERAIHGLVADALMKTGFRSTVTDFLAHAIGNELITQRGVEQMNAAKGLGASETLGQNPVAAFGELTTSIANFGAVLTSPAMQQAGGVMHSLAAGISSVTQSLKTWQDDNPNAAKAAGVAAPAAAAAAGGWVTWKGASSLWNRFGGGGAARGAAQRAGGGLLAGSLGAAGRLLSGPIGAGALTAGVLNSADSEGNLLGLTSGIDRWAERNLGFNPSNVQLVRQRSEQEKTEINIGRETATWGVAAQQSMREYISVLSQGGADAETKAQAIGVKIQQFLTVDGRLTVNTESLERALSLARQYADTVRSLPGSSAPVTTPTKVDGARASGGPVSAGKTYLVGEKGQELFTPQANGSIIPNHALGGGMEPRDTKNGVYAPISLVINVKGGGDNGKLAAQIAQATQNAVNEALGALDRKLNRSSQIGFSNLSYSDS